MIFLQVRHGGISQSVNLAFVVVSGLDEPRKGSLVFLSVNLFGDDAAESHIGIILAHLDEILLASVAMPYRDRLLSCQSFEFLSEPFYLSKTDHGINIKLEKELHVPSIDECRIFLDILIPIYAAFVRA